MRKIISLFLMSIMLILSTSLYSANENARQDANLKPVGMGVVDPTREIRMVRLTKEGYTIISISTGSTGGVIITSGNVNATQSGKWDVTVSSFPKIVICNTKDTVITSGTVNTVDITDNGLSYYYVSISSIATTSVTATGLGLSYMVRAYGGDVEFNIDGYSSIPVYTKEGFGDDFKGLITNPTINVTSLQSGATVVVFISTKK